MMWWEENDRQFVCGKLLYRSSSQREQLVLSRTTKQGRVLPNREMLNRVSESPVNTRYRLPILDNTLIILFALSELLLNIVVVGREYGENESQNSKRTDESRHHMTVETVALAQRSCRTRAAIAFAHEIHLGFSRGLGFGRELWLRLRLSDRAWSSRNGEFQNPSRFLTGEYLYAPSPYSSTVKEYASLGDQITRAIPKNSNED